MKNIYGILAAAVLAVFLISGCGSSSNEAGTIIKKQVNVTEAYVNSLEKANSADEVVKAIENYTRGMKELIPELMEFEKKYPELKAGKIPQGMDAEFKRMEEISAKIPGSMMKITQYMMDSKVQAAMQQMGEEMSKAE